MIVALLAVLLLCWMKTCNIKCSGCSEWASREALYLLLVPSETLLVAGGSRIWEFAPFAWRLVALLDQLWFQHFLHCKIFRPICAWVSAQKRHLESSLNILFKNCNGLCLNVKGYTLKALLNGKDGDIHTFGLTYNEEMHSPLSKQRKCIKTRRPKSIIYFTNSIYADYV